MINPPFGMRVSRRQIMRLGRAYNTTCREAGLTHLLCSKRRMRRIAARNAGKVLTP